MNREIDNRMQTLQQSKQRRNKAVPANIFANKDVLIKISEHANFNEKFFICEKSDAALFLEPQWFRENQVLKNIFKLFFI